MKNSTYYLIAAEVATLASIIAFTSAELSRQKFAVGGEIFVFPMIMLIAYEIKKHKEAIKYYANSILYIFKRY